MQAVANALIALSILLFSAYFWPFYSGYILPIAELLAFLSLSTPPPPSLFLYHSVDFIVTLNIGEYYE